MYGPHIFPGFDSIARFHSGIVFLFSLRGEVGSVFGPRLAEPEERFDAASTSSDWFLVSHTSNLCGTYQFQETTKPNSQLD